MEIVESNPFKIESPPEVVKVFYLYMTEEPAARPQVFFSVSADHQNEAAKYLGSFNMPMICMQIRGTENEVLEFREKLEKERTQKWEEWKKKNG